MKPQRGGVLVHEDGVFVVEPERVAQHLGDIRNDDGVGDELLERVVAMQQRPDVELVAVDYAELVEVICLPGVLAPGIKTFKGRVESFDLRPGQCVFDHKVPAKVE